MKVINFISYSIVPIFLFIVVSESILEKKNGIKYFFEGVIQGEKTVINMFPTLLAIMVGVGIIKESGIVDFICNCLINAFWFLKEYKEILPLAMLRPISGSTSIGLATNIMKENGVDSYIGLLTSILMGSTETTIYVVSVYLSNSKIKKIKPLIIIGLIGDFICVISCIIASKIFF